MQKTSREIQRFRKYVNKTCLELRWYFFANLYRMEIEWADSEKKTKGPDTSVATEIQIDEHYMNFTIIVYKKCYDLFEEGNFDRLNEVLLHEFCHLLTEPLYWCALQHMPESALPHLEKLRERQTEMIRMVLDHFDKTKIFGKPRKTRRAQ